MNTIQFHSGATMAKTLMVAAFVLVSIVAANSRRLEPKFIGRIVGGSDAPNGQYPYQASLQYKGRHNCGASIVDNEWVVTAAHCVDGDAVEDLSVYAGSNKLSSGGRSYAVLEIHSHEQYDPIAIKNDVAILKVQRITYSDRIRPIVLDSEYVGGNEPCVLSGWGLISMSPVEFPDNMQHLPLETTSLEFCQSQISYPVDKDEICATSHTIGQGACSSDSGGPLARKVNGTVKQIGVVSWGIPCGIGYPDVYARVSSYIDWFREKCNCV